MIMPIAAKVSWSSFFAGTAVAAVGAVIARPIIVGTVRAGYGASDMVTDAWTKAKAEVESVKQEALAARNASQMASELQQLRDEVAALKTQLAKR